jgi:hypothetical protein
MSNQNPLVQKTSSMAIKGLGLTTAAVLALALMIGQSQHFRKTQSPSEIVAHSPVQNSQDSQHF